MKRHFNVEHALFGFLSTGIPAALLNGMSGNVSESIMAGVYQGILTSVIVGFNVAFFEKLYHRDFGLFSIVIPSLLSAFISLYTHSILGSPEPLFTAFMIFIFGLWNYSLYYATLNKWGTLSLRKISKKSYNWFLALFLKE